MFFNKTESHISIKCCSFSVQGFLEITCPHHIQKSRGFFHCSLLGKANNYDCLLSALPECHTPLFLLSHPSSTQIFHTKSSSISDNFIVPAVKNSFSKGQKSISGVNILTSPCSCICNAFAFHQESRKTNKRLQTKIALLDAGEENQWGFTERKLMQFFYGLFTHLWLFPYCFNCLLLFLQL